MNSQRHPPVQLQELRLVSMANRPKVQMENLMFVGERRSQSAIRMDVPWEDGRLAAKQLF